jgi:hypothetical protein
MQRKTLVRVLGLEKRVTDNETRISNLADVAIKTAEEQAAQAEDPVDIEQAVEEVEQAAEEVEQAAEEVEQAAEEVQDAIDDVEEVIGDEVVDEIPEELEGEDEIPAGLDDILDDVRSEPEVKKPEVKKPEPKKKKPEAKKKKPKKKRPPIKAKKRKISAKDLAKGTPFDAGYKSRVLGEDEEGEYLSKEERKRRFKFGDTQEKDGVSKTIKDVSKSPEQPSSPLDGLLGIINSIAGGVDSIRQTLMDQQKLSQEQVSEQREEQQNKKRGMKEKALEAGGKIMGGAKKIGEKVLAPVKSLWTKLMNFLVGVLLGNAVIKLFEWFTDPANTDKVSSLFKFLKDWWPVLLASIMAFVPALLGPGGFIIGTIALLAWGIPKIVNIVKSLFGFGKDVDKELKNVDTDATKTGEELGKNIENDAKKLGGDAPETEDPAKSSTPAEIVDADKSQKDLQNIKQPQGMKEGGPVQSKDGGKVEGEKGVDKVPAMLTEGEFVLSKGAVQAYGVDTLAAMNAAAGGTNKPTEKDGKPAYAGGGPVGKPDTSHFGTTGYRMGQMLPEQFYYSKETLTSSYKEKGGKVLEDKTELTELGGAIGMPDLIEHQEQLVNSIQKVEGYENINFMDVVQYPSGQGRLVGIPEETFFPILNSSDAWKASDAKRDEAIRMDQEAGTTNLNPLETTKSVGLNAGGLVPAYNVGGLVQSISNIMTMNQGGKVSGNGNKDTVPAMLTPGEFVMNKVSTAKIGVQNLMKMNANMGKGILGGVKKLAMKNPIAQLFSGAKDKLGKMMGDKGGDEDKVIGIAVADIPKGSPLMKSAKPPAGDAIKPPKKSSGGAGGVQVDNSLTQGLNSGTQGGTGAAGGQTIPSFEADVHISQNKLAVLGVRI